MKRLEAQLKRIDGKGYKAYKDIQGTYQGDGYKLHIDYVQGDPFASPSRIRLEIPQSKAPLNSAWYHSPLRKITLEDFLTREMAAAIRKLDGTKMGTGKSGLIAVDTPGQEILPRTSAVVNDERLELRLSVGLPARGRQILGKQACRMLLEQIPQVLEEAVYRLNRDRLERHMRCTDQQVSIQDYLAENGYVAFIANGAILPRESGASNRPLKGAGVIPFQSPPSLEVAIPIPHATEPIRGMAIPEGITLIVGGGYHGKSTLLKAIERGVYRHIPGDGREYVITNPSACKIRAEDGRRVEKVNISPFISNLPYGKDTRQFSTEDASGSTSQAANIVEALEVGAQVLLIDEDTSATNFMIRDARMQQLVAKGKEPITPFVDKVCQLYEELNVSTILVLGGSGDYLDVADQVIMMDEYRPLDVTQRAKDIASVFENRREREGGGHFGRIIQRVPLPQSFDARKGKKEKVDAKGLHTIMYGRHLLDLTFVEQIVDASQTRALAHMIRWLAKHEVDGETSLSMMIDRLYENIDKKGLDCISPYGGQHPGDLALPRKYELAAAINRLRSLRAR